MRSVASQHLGLGSHLYGSRFCGVVFGDFGVGVGAQHSACPRHLLADAIRCRSRRRPADGRGCARRGGARAERFGRRRDGRRAWVAQGLRWASRRAPEGRSQGRALCDSRGPVLRLLGHERRGEDDDDEDSDRRGAKQQWWRHARWLRHPDAAGPRAAASRLLPTIRRADVDFDGKGALDIVRSHQGRCSGADPRLCRGHVGLADVDALCGPPGGHILWRHEAEVVLGHCPHR
mmetsp:Transcript_29205/g.83855  ORF Transcript_29205/g.83855 Transcript_29205/m.83855 type:complete len:233 (+) Transcript_29205:4584-5282(+)